MSSNNQHPPSSSASGLPGSSAPVPTTHSDSNVQLGNNGYAPNDNQLAGLVEAATQAADQNVSQWATAEAIASAAGAAGHHHQLEAYGADMHLGDDGFGDAKFDANFANSMGGARQMRAPSHTDNQSPGLTRTATKKRKRNDDNLDPALAGAGLAAAQHQAQSQQTPHGYTGEGMEIRTEQPQSLSDARAVGVHSAAALFRQPSSNKKYTRPPISKMFSSLEISPENFLHLQAAAKNYMLDDDHPERRDCVGQRGKGDTEMVKLRLWNCVRQFLEAEGNGERFFGENVANEGMGPRNYIWPRDQQKIISLVIPLLRRMVTNERQRQYAIETRKGGGTDDRRRRRTEEFSNLNNRFSPDQSLMQNQSHREDMSQSMPSHQLQQSLDQSQPITVGLTDLLLDGYTVDWEEIARTYEAYNQGFELDNLWSLSGLQQPDWRGLVAAVDSHYHVIHNDGYDCPPECEDENINRIIHADATSSLSWRIGGGRHLPARDELYVLLILPLNPILTSPTVLAVSPVTSPALFARTSPLDTATPSPTTTSTLCPSLLCQKIPSPNPSPTSPSASTSFKAENAFSPGSTYQPANTLILKPSSRPFCVDIPASFLGYFLKKGTPLHRKPANLQLLPRGKSKSGFQMA